MSDKLHVSKPIVETIAIDEEALEKYGELLQGAGLEIKDFLPTKSRQRVQFDIQHAYTEIANGLRRALIEEIPVSHLHVEEADIETNDEFIMLHMLQRSVSMLVIEQGITINTGGLKLAVKNDTAEIITILASSITGAANCVTHPQAPIINLRPGKFLRIGKFQVRQAHGYESMMTASFLTNVSYQIRGVDVYDAYEKKGKRSVSYDPDTFAISYETCGNCEPLYPLRLAIETLIAKFEKIAAILEGKDPEMQLSITHQDTYLTYAFTGFYLTESTWIAKAIYRLDPAITYVSGSVARFDSQVAIVKIASTQHATLMKQAVAQIIADLGVVRSSVNHT